MADLSILGDTETDDSVYTGLLIRNKVVDMLLSCTPEYLTLVYANKLKIPRIDRHGRDVMCLCQYLEKVDKDFGKKVKSMKSLRRKSNIEENDENNKHLKDITLC
ncbi:hypothetical protein CHS0354_030144 [Potamilus streckersoni]|uniref:Uncharacterized protein n=1 Tax=Potamilus streckersoni TaxID=2493646 RepID=A0AAE0W281_9BIVA|nr:hypothetical protein CHS0354_030144 [Potamilus streckersoni]